MLLFQGLRACCQLVLTCLNGLFMCIVFSVFMRIRVNFTTRVEDPHFLHSSPISNRIIWVFFLEGTEGTVEKIGGSWVGWHVLLNYIILSNNFFLFFLLVSSLREFVIILERVSHHAVWAVWGVLGIGDQIHEYFYYNRIQQLAPQNTKCTGID